MITRLEVDGFKSLRDFSIDLEPFTVLVGPNGAGKSNILEVLALLSRLTHMSPVEALSEGRGLVVDQFTRTRDGSDSAIRIAAEFFDPEESLAEDTVRQTRYRLELSLARHRSQGPVGEVRMGAERLIGLSQEMDAWLQKHPALRRFGIHTRPGPLADEIMSPSPARGKARPWWLDGLSTTLSSLHVHIDTQQLRAPSEQINQSSFAPDASNLAAVLASLPPQTLGHLRAALATVIPGIASFEVVPDREMLHIEFRLSDGTHLPARLASDGTMRVLALLTAAHVEGGPGTICIEEPENGIYPRRLRDLLAILKDRATPTTDGPLPPQFIFTTHSPAAIAALQHDPSCLRFVDSVRRNGERVTRVRSIGEPGPGDHGRTVASPREISDMLDLGPAEDDQ